MPRIRSIKPEFCTSPDTGELSVHLAAHLPRLWTYADDEGRGVDDPRAVKAALWPLNDDVTHAAIEQWHAELEAKGRIERYVGPDGRRYFSIPKFRVHQHPKRFVSSKLPPPPSELLGDPMQGRCGEQTAAMREHAGPVVGVGGEGVLNKTPSGVSQVEASLRGVPDDSSDSDLSAAFDQIWKQWPNNRRGSLTESRRKWREIVSTESAKSSVVDGAETWLAHWRADQTPTRFIPKLSNWLRDEGWLEPPPPLRRDAASHTVTGHPSTDVAVGLYLAGNADQDTLVAAVAAQCAYDPRVVPQQASWDFRARYEAALKAAVNDMHEATK